MTEETWRNPNMSYPQKIRQIDPNDSKTQDELESEVAWLSHDWCPANSHIDLQPQDDEVYEEIQKKILNYFEVSLTSC